ncbi:MAG: protein phosphatase 2C domain-containing protein [Verrucomicrobiales bacterium]|nr:protein phosphatase 2C domain-containing protein [Verrucomicrobiales bacterium]
MKAANDGISSIVRIGYDGKVYKTFTGSDRKERFENETRLLGEMEARGCDFVPRLLDANNENFTIVTTNCGSPVQKIAAEKVKQIFKVLKEEFGVIHEDPIPGNITYDPHRGCFCVINFENATVLGNPIKIAEARILSWYGTTRSGMRKEDNEDSLSVFSNQSGSAHEETLQGIRKISDGSLIFAVSDGMGGHSGGAMASQLVVSQLHRYIPSALGEFDGVGSPVALLEKAIFAVHDHVLRIADSRPEVADMGATVVCCIFSRTELHFGHVGDSRLYRFRDGSLRQLTEDHSFVGKLQEEGKISEREARLNPRRNILTQAIGAQCEIISPEVSSVQIKQDDWFLICSDGVVDGLWDKQIEQEFLMAGLTNNTPKGVATSLLERAYKEAGRDDTTLFVIKVE